MGDIKEIFDVWVSRIRSPLFGYFSLSFAATNWKEIYFLVFAKTDVLSRIEYFESNTQLITLLWIPLGISVFAVLTYPWIQLALHYAVAWPNKLRNELNATAESDLLLKKAELDNTRNEIALKKQQDAIDRAKIDESVESIQDETAKETARKEIQAIRESEALLRLPINQKSLEKYLIARYPELPTNDYITSMFIADLNPSRYRTIADVERLLSSSEEFVDYYKEQNPSKFESSIDYVTKSFGYGDREFIKKHLFSSETIEAMERFKSP